MSSLVKPSDKQHWKSRQEVDQAPVKDIGPTRQ